VATNPRIPDRETHPVPVQRPPSTTAVEISTRGMLTAILGVVALGLIFYFASRIHEHATAVESPDQAVAPAGSEGPQSELEFSDVQMEVTGDGRLDIFGRVRNTGNHHITGALVQLTFRDAKGKKVASIQQPIHGKKEAPSSALADEFPIEPDQSRFFQVVINQVPPKWNHELPELKVVTVSASE